MQNEKMRDFVKSLENDQLSKDQEAMLLVGKADDLQAGNNGSCENRSSSCDLSINNRKCTNGSSTGCECSLNGRKCTKIDRVISQLNPVVISKPSENLKP